MRRMCRLGLVGLVACVGNIGALVAADAPQADSAKDSFRYGADLRLRQEAFDDIPIRPGGVTRGGENNYFRIRPDVWGELDLLDNVTFRARLVGEWREWVEPDMSAAPDRSNSKFPDEYVFDHLYVDFKDLLDKKLDIRVGRQDLIYGTGKVVLEGTPKDGSRTIYFNAAKAVWKGIPDTTIDLVGIYNESIDSMALNDVDRDLTGVDKNNDDITEAGGILYVKNKGIKQMPYEVYGIYKNESDWVRTPNPTTSVDVAALDIWTFGFRVMPDFGGGLKGNLEMAYQIGDRDGTEEGGWMLDAAAAYALPDAPVAKPVLNAGVYYLSGDDPSTSDNEGWNPLWARYPQYSELYIYSFDAEAAGRWQNVMMPNVGFSVYPHEKVKTSAMVAYLLANEDDGPGTGKERGWLYVAKAEMNLASGLLSKGDKLSAHMWLELLTPGDYYIVNDTAYFARWQLMYSFM